MRSIVHKLSRGTTALVIDHHQVNHAPNSVNIHYEERDTTGALIRGDDLDGVTVEELGGTGEIATAITGAKLAKVLSDAAGGLPTTVAVKPPEPKVEAEKSAASTDAP